MATVILALDPLARDVCAAVKTHPFLALAFFVWELLAFSILYRSAKTVSKI